MTSNTIEVSTFEADIPDISAEKIFDNFDGYFDSSYAIKSLEEQTEQVRNLIGAFIKKTRGKEESPAFVLGTYLEKDGRLESSVFQPPYELFEIFRPELTGVTFGSSELGLDGTDGVPIDKIRKNIIDGFSLKGVVAFTFVRSARSASLVWKDPEGNELDVPDEVVTLLVETSAKRVTELSESLGYSETKSLSDIEDLKSICLNQGLKLGSVEVSSQPSFVAASVTSGGERYSEMVTFGGYKGESEKMIVSQSKGSEAHCLPSEVEGFIQSYLEHIQAQEGVFN